MWLHTSVSQGFVPDSWCKLGSSPLRLSAADLCCAFWCDKSLRDCVFMPIMRRKNKGGIYGARRAKTGLNVNRSGLLTRTGSDVALLVFLCQPLTDLTPILGLWVGAGSLAAAYPTTAVPAALRPGGPGWPATVHSVPGDLTEAENVSCVGRVLTGWQCCECFQGTMSYQCISLLPELLYK